MEPFDAGRKFLKSDRWGEWRQSQTDQKNGVPCPPLEKSFPSGASLIDLVAPGDFSVGQVPLIEAINRRKSHRTFTAEYLTLEELSFLLWATLRVRTCPGTRPTIKTMAARSFSSGRRSPIAVNGATVLWRTNSLHSMPVTSARICIWQLKPSTRERVPLTRTIKTSWMRFWAWTGKTSLRFTLRRSGKFN